MAVAVDYIDDWRGRLQSRLQAQFSRATTWNLWCTDVLGRQAQDVEDAAQTLLAILSIPESEGAQLDVIGRIVGQARSAGVATDDETYRLYLLARIISNLSDGAPGAIYAVFNQLFGRPGQRLTKSRIKAFTLQIFAPITPAQALVALGFLHDAKDATDGAQLLWQEAPDAQMFTFAGGSYLAAAASPGDTTITVLDGAQLAAAGVGKLSPRISAAESIGWTSNAGGVLTLAAPLASAHARGAAVEPDNDPGLGFGDSTDPTVGGVFAGADEAA
jgi:hypothetical protein